MVEGYFFWRGDMDVVVIGAGIIGLSTAWRLGGMGHRVSIFEARTIGGGATGASLGALWPPMPHVVGPLQMLHRKSLGMMEGFVKEVAEEGECAVGFRRCGRLEFLEDAKAEERARKELLGSEGLTVITAEEVRELEPGVEAGGRAALKCEVTAEVEVGALVHALAVACRTRGVMFHERTPIDDVEMDEGGFSVGAAKHRYTGDRLLVAAGAWTGQLHPLLMRFAATRPAKGQALEMRTAGRVMGRIVKRGTTYVVPWEGKVLVGSTTEPEAGFDESVREEAVAKLRAEAVAMVPGLAGAEVVRSWAGLRPDAPKHRPVMGKVPGCPSVYVSAGHFKTGIGMSAAVSAMVAAEIME